MNTARKSSPSSVTAGEQEVYADQFDEKVECPWCQSENNQVVSPFGGTVSEILFRCEDCDNVFGWMKWDNRLPD